MSFGKIERFSALAILISILTIQSPFAECANILGVFTSSSPSHLIVHMSVVKALAEEGHNVTVITSLKPKVSHPAINLVIIPPSNQDEQELNRIISEMAGKKNGVVTLMKNFFGSFTTLIDMQVNIMKDQRFTAFYENKDNKFDLIILGYFMNDFVLGVGAKLKAPMIINWMGPTNQLTDRYVGNPAELSYVPHMMVGFKNGEKMSFFQRLKNLFVHKFFEIFFTIMNYRFENYYKELFGNDKDMPSMSDMGKKVSAVFCNGHFSEGPIRPNLPAVIEIGGIQVKDKPDPLPKDIAEFLDSAKQNGAILFSLGSNLKGNHIKPEIIQTIFKVLSTLKQKVIWKWEDLDQTPGESSNILYKKWLPQDDILAHPNLKLFITHAGKGGVAEAQYHSIPMLALPVFAEQPANAEKLVESGYGLKLDMLSLKEDEFKKSILEVINNPKYKQNIEKFSKLYRDRPLTAKQNVIFWADYIIRHHGAFHMQSPSVHMSFIELYNLDVYFLLISIVYLLYRLVRYGPCLFSNKCKTSNDKKLKSNSTKTRKGKKDKAL